MQHNLKWSPKTLNPSVIIVIGTRIAYIISLRTKIGIGIEIVYRILLGKNIVMYLVGKII